MAEAYEPREAEFYRAGDAIEVADHLEILIRQVEGGKMSIHPDHCKLFEATLLSHSYPEPRRKAAVLLGMVGTATSVKPLKTAKSIERDSMVLRAVTAALDKINRRKNVN